MSDEEQAVYRLMIFFTAVIFALMVLVWFVSASFSIAVPLVFVGGRQIVKRKAKVG